MHFLRGAAVVLSFVLLTVSRAQAEKDLETITSEHLASRGGYDRVVGLLRYEMRGSISKNGTRLPFHVWWKQPNKLRIDVGRGDQTVTSVYDGATAWTTETGPWGNEPTGMVPGLRELFLRQADWHGPFLHPEKKGLRVVPDPVCWGDSGYQALVHCGSSEPDRVFLNPNTRMISWETFQVGPPGFEIAFEQRYSRFRRTEGFALAHEIERYVDGEPYDVIEIDELIIGPPVADYLFDKPVFKTPTADSPRLLDLNQIGQLRDRFQANAGDVRIVAILSPTSASSRRGFLDLKRMVDSAGDDRVSAYVVWTPVLETDSRAAAAARVLESANPDLVPFWDGELTAAREWREVLKQKRNAWDVYLIYGPDAKWETLPPVPDLSMAQNLGTGPGYDLNLAQGVVKIRELLAAKPGDGKKRRASASDQ